MSRKRRPKLSAAELTALYQAEDEAEQAAYRERKKLHEDTLIFGEVEIILSSSGHSRHITLSELKQLLAEIE